MFLRNLSQVNYLAQQYQNGVPWPKIEGKLTFKGYEFTLRPETETLLPSIIVEIPSGIPYETSITLCREFMSILSWVDDAPLREEIVSGGGFPANVGKGPKWRAIHTDKLHIRYLPEITDPKAKLAIALYREAQNVNSIPYKFLGYFKILNILLDGRRKHSKWINDNVSKLEGMEAGKLVADILKTHPDVGLYLYESGRCAVAHAYDVRNIVNPDDVYHQQRLQRELPIVKALAELMIEQDLGVKSKRTYYKEHQYELAGFREKIESELTKRLENGDSFVLEEPRSIGIISLEIRDEKPYPALTGLECNYREAIQGVLHLECNSQDGILKLDLRLNFPSTRLEFDYDRDLAVNVDGSRKGFEALRDCWKFVRDLIGNGEIEVTLQGSQVLLGRKDPYIPVNLEIGVTFKNIDLKIKEIENQIQNAPE